MGDNFIKLSSGAILNISGIESLVIITKAVDKATDTVQYEKHLRIVTKSGNILYENANCLDVILKEIYIVNTESEQQLDQLKAENNLLRQTHKTEQDRRRAYENALTEIKEIAKDYANNDWTGLAIKFEQILEKCEVLDE